MDHGHDEERSWSRIDNKPAGNYQIETLDMDQMNQMNRGPWTVEEDQLLMNYITKHGEGRWNSLSRSAGLKRTGKSCRLRWLNYLRPDVRRGNITLREQLLILELHFRWGNRWSKMAEYLPGRTDNEIKNYWRTRVQKHAKQLNCDVNSKQFNDIIRQIWMPRLVERIQAESAKSELDNAWNNNNNCMNIVDHEVHDHDHDQLDLPTFDSYNDFGSSQVIINELYDLPDQSSPTTISSDSFESTQVNSSNISDPAEFGQQYYPDSLISPMGGYFSHGLDFSTTMEHSCDNQYWSDSVQLADTSDNLWNMDDIWFIQ